MATPLQVPRQYEGGFAKIRDLSDESAQEFLSALRKAPPTFNARSISSVVASMVDTIAASDVEEMVPALLSLYSYRDISQWSISDVVEGIARAMEESTSKRLILPAEERGSFEERLSQLLSIEALDVAVRGGDVLLETERSFQEVRVLTDVRPIFEPENPKANPKGAVIAHSLKIKYWDGYEAKDFFVTLDTADVRTFLDHLERANAKAESLKSLLKRADVKYIDAE